MIKLHLGCGKRNFGHGWYHVDAHPYPHVDSSDIRLCSFSKNEIDIIYASHFLEYLTPGEAKCLLNMWLYVLKPGGLIRLAVPDFEAMMKLYVFGRYDLQSFLGPIYGEMESAGKTIFHKTGYDFRILKQLLEDVGFVNVERYCWRDTEHSHIDDHSQAYLPHMDRKEGTLISLNVEATKIN